MRRRKLPTSASLGCALALALAVPAPRAAEARQGAAAASSPLSLAIVYDTSASAADNSGRSRRAFAGKKALFAALADFVRREHPQNEYFVIRFDTVPRVVLDGTTDKEVALKAISKLSSASPEGATSLFDACLLAVGKVAKGRHDRRAIILIGDGKDTVSAGGMEDVVASLARSGVALYAINIDRPSPKQPSLDSSRLSNEVLGRMAAASNGELFGLGGDQDRVVAFEVIAARLRRGGSAPEQR